MRLFIAQNKTMKKLFLLFPVIFLLYQGKLMASPGDTVIFTTLGHFYYDTITPKACYSPLIDRMGRPYVYGASVDMGMITFDISNQMNPFPIDTITPAELGGFGYKATFIAQQQDTLFIATGGFQVAGNKAGLQTWDFTNPNAPVLLDRWDSTAFTHGCSHIIVQGNYAYLAAMDDGVIILDVSDKYNIQFVSQLTLSATPSTPYNPHARGLYLGNDTLVVADDGGGLRIVDVSNVNAPVQIGSYLNTLPTAQDTVYPFYNHVWCLGRHCYIPLDYAGFEVDDISNPQSVQNEAYANYWNNTGVWSWFGSDGHTNEIVWTGLTTNVMMVSGADSQVLAVDPSDPSDPRIMGWWGPPNTDNLAAWGVDEFNGLVVCGYLRDTWANQPYYSTYGGIQLLSWILVTETNEIAAGNPAMHVYPNPTNDLLTIALPGTSSDVFTIEIMDIAGRVVMTQPANPRENGRNAQVDVSGLSAGSYTVRVSSGDVVCTAPVIVQ